MSNENFNEEVVLNSYFQLWDRGDGVGEISLFNSIVGYIHSPKQIYPEDYYHYDESLETYVSDESEFVPVSCFPGILSSSNEILKYFNNNEIDSIEHLISLVSSVSTDLLPNKPKGSIIDIFSNQEKFLISRDFDFDTIKNGLELSPAIIQNFNDLSSLLKNKFTHYPEVSVSFLNHSYIHSSGNVYFIYEINQYYLHLVFTKDNHVILGSINKSAKMQDIVILDCNEKNYNFVFETIVDKLKLLPHEARISLNLISEAVSSLPRGKNKFIIELLHEQINPFLSKISNSSAFILERNLQALPKKEQDFIINRDFLIQLKEHSSIFDLSIEDFISILINDYFHKDNQYS